MAIAALKGDETLATLAEKFDVHANQITQWKTQLLENATNVFATASEKRSRSAISALKPAAARAAFGRGRFDSSSRNSFAPRADNVAPDAAASPTG